MPHSRFDRFIIGADDMLALGGLASGTAYGQGAAISQSGGAVSADCGGGDATVNGSGNSITFRNPCRALTVTAAETPSRSNLSRPGPLQ
jgi:hypothetical protein